MIYTHSYWVDLCKGVLKKKFHHGPTKGGVVEKVKYDNQYDYTLQIYKEELGYDAPKDIWPNKEERFGNIEFRRVSTRDNIILNKKSVFNYMTGFLIGIVLTLSGFIFMSVKSTDDEASNVVEIFMWVIGIAFAIFVIRGIYRYVTRNDKRNDNNSGGSSSGSGGCTIATAFFGCGGCGSSGCSSSGCGSSGCGSSDRKSVV